MNSCSSIKAHCLAVLCRKKQEEEQRKKEQQKILGKGRTKLSFSLGGR
jgi:hypothetical protein